MGTPFIMDIEEAYRTVQFCGEQYGHSNLWGALQAMENNWDDLDSMDRAAYKMVKRELEKEVKSVRIIEDDGGLD
jgi:hypothetical protein